MTEICENLDFRLPVSEANDNDLTTIQGKNGKAKGQVVYIRGKVLRDTWGTLKPVQGAVLIEWIERLYDDNFQYWERCITDADGNYSFKTIVLGFYPVNFEKQWYRPPHLHFMVMAPGVPQLVTQLYFKGEQVPGNDFIQELNAKDGILRSNRMTQAEQESVIIEYTKDSTSLITDGLVGHYNFVLTL
ncbi:MAG: hypothetical protein NPIRA02_35990 [Nitrospirales bacterium]|nr:MAG: hypothetical protein NPIRA02_35990 [Nitrospirales bacterium]